ncbi:MAG: HipA N-terminal domain-containing protein [Thermodesulfobacteriota bacterium]|nr:HipA N-terminal domain-containing protein [Thermodesulfobacteriota bacterium]
MKNRKNSADVYLWDTKAALLERNDREYRFSYYEDYLSLPDAQPVSLTLTLTGKPYESESLFPFFLGLIPEGWLLDITSRTLKIDPENVFDILLATCGDCIGVVKIIPVDEENN